MKNEKPWEDPIVAEVHRIREEIAKEHNYDLRAYLADIIAHQKGTVTTEKLKAGSYPTPSDKSVMVRETPPKKPRAK